jgi:hypothetical protein
MRPEDTEHGISQKGEKVVARWDLGYQVRRVSTAAWSTMAILEFKRPLSITYEKWAGAIQGTATFMGAVEAPDHYIVQQSKKYNHVGKRDYVALYDWVSFVELVNTDGLAEGRSPIPGESGAYYRWTDARKGPIRLRLFEFLFEALMQYLGPNVKVQVQQQIFQLTRS